MPDIKTMLDGQPLFERIKAMPGDERAQRLAAINDRVGQLDAYERLSGEQAAERKQLLDEGEAHALAHALELVTSGRVGFEAGSEPGATDDGWRSGAGKAGPFAAAVLDAGFNLRTKPTVVVDGYKMLKASTFPAVTDWYRRQPVMVPKGQDRRWLFPHLPTENLGTDTTIQDYRQNSRTLTGTVKRNLDATTDKAKLDVAVALIAEAAAQFAVTIDDIPNAILESVRPLSAFLENEGQFQVYKAIDDHVYAQIVAATPPFGMTGTTLIEKLRNGVATMRATGANPTVAVLNPTDAASLDLTEDAGGFVFPVRDTGTSSPLWSLTIVERIGAGTEPPYLIDPAMLGVLYLGRLRFAADPYTGFRKNLTTLRVEVNGLYHVRNADGARRIAAT